MMYKTIVDLRKFRIKIFYKFTLLYIFFNTAVLDVEAGKIPPELIEELKSAVLSIKTRETRKAYDSPDTRWGTGFLLNKEKGIILTNRHLAAIDSPAIYEGMWVDGSIAELRLIWNDPTNDFAFLKIDIDKIPVNAPQIKLSETVKLGEKVFSIGNNEGRTHSVQKGEVHDLFNFFTTDLETQSFSIILNTKGGASGSPLFNKEGKSIGLLFGKTDTTAAVLPIACVKSALEKICDGKIPPRFSIGAIFKNINLNQAQAYYQYRNFSLESALKNIHGAQNRILQVFSLLPHAQLLEVGDIVEKVNEKTIGPDHSLVERELNQSEGKPVKFTVYRNGKYLDLNVPVFDLNNSICSKMIIFGGTVFSTVDPIRSLETGIPIGSVCIGGKDSGCLFQEVPICPMTAPLAQVMRIMGKEIKTLQDLINILPHLVKIKKFNYVIKDLSFTYNMREIERPLYAHYKPEQYSDPVIIEFDQERYDWVRRAINL